MSHKCNICNAEQSLLFKGLILGKYKIQYFKCNNCGYINTENPYWLNESYSEAIAVSDIGYVFRNVKFSQRLSRILKLNFSKKSAFLDYGAGYGMLVRLMRDFGFNFYYYDLYCKNIFSEGFEYKDDKIDATIAIEVFEHIENPDELVSDLLSKTNTIIFSTLLRKKEYTNNQDWWYFTPETGQHISFFTIESLRFLAKKHNAYFYSNKKDLHIISLKKIKRTTMGLDLIYSKVLDIFDKLFLYKNKSLLDQDYRNTILTISPTKTSPISDSISD